MIVTTTEGNTDSSHMFALEYVENAQPALYRQQRAPEVEPIQEGADGIEMLLTTLLRAHSTRCKPLKNIEDAKED